MKFRGLISLTVPKCKDYKFHIFPTVPPELYGLRPGFKYNYDCTVDLTLTLFIFKAFLDATRLLGEDKNETAEILSGINRMKVATIWYSLIFIYFSFMDDSLILSLPLRTIV
jgi:hypothetical protein